MNVFVSLDVFMGTVTMKLLVVLVTMDGMGLIVTYVSLEEAKVQKTTYPKLRGYS